MSMYVMLAQTSAEGPSWLEGSLTLPFEWVGLGVGLACLGGFVYFALRASRDAQESQAEREWRDRMAAHEERPKP